MSENEDYFGQPMREYGPNKLPPYYVIWKLHQPKPGEGGYKVYVDTEIQYAGTVARHILPLLREKKIAHKFIPTLQYVGQVYRGVYDDTSRGKFIVTYPSDYEVEVHRLIRAIDDLLIPLGLPLARDLVPIDRHSDPPGPCKGMGKSGLILISHVKDYSKD